MAKLEILTADHLVPITEKLDALQRQIAQMAAPPKRRTVAEYAKDTGLSPATVRRKCNRGELKAERVGERKWMILE